MNDNLPKDSKAWEAIEQAFCSNCEYRLCLAIGGKPYECPMFKDVHLRCEAARWWHRIHPHYARQDKKCKYEAWKYRRAT